MSAALYGMASWYGMLWQRGMVWYGNVVALVSGGVICLIVSYMTSEQVP